MEKEKQPIPAMEQGIESVNAKFNEVIESFLQPLQEIELDKKSVDDLNSILEKLGEKALEKSLILLIESCKNNGIKNLNLQTWIGPQGVGKGATSDTMRWTKDLILGNNTEEIFGMFRNKYGISESEISEIQALAGKIPEIDSILEKIFNSLAGDNLDRVSTGTGGIFYPSGSDKPNIRYLPYKKQETVTGKIVCSGAMINPEWTNALVVLEIARSVAYGKNSIDLDVYPRTLDQSEFLEKLRAKLQDEGIELQHQLIHIEPIDEETANLIKRYSKTALGVYRKVGNVFLGISDNPEEYGFSDAELNLIKALGIENDKPEDQRKKLMEEGSVLMRQKAQQMKDLIVSKTEDADNPTEERIGLGLAASVGTTFFRVANRLSTQGREDDADIRKLAKRLGIYYSETALVAIQKGSKPIWAGGKNPDNPPAKNYEDAIEGTINALTKSIDPKYEPSEDFMKLITEVYLIRTSI